MDPGRRTGEAGGRLHAGWGVIAGLMRKVRLLLLAGAGARRHDTERCCQGVKSTFFLAPSRLNGLRGREFEGEAGEPVFGLVRGLARGKGGFWARTTVTCVHFAGRSVTLKTEQKSHFLLRFPPPLSFLLPLISVRCC